MRGRNTIAGGPATKEQKACGHAPEMLGPKLRIVTLFFLILHAGVIPTSLWAAEGEASEHFLQFLEIPLEGDNLPAILSFPLYEQNNIRYFSAGLGKEERSLAYPPYPLKLIFVKGERAYLTNVAVEVLHPDGTTLLSIPKEEVQGPWLFVNLTGGKYIIKATDSSGITQEKTIKLSTNTTTVYFRWE